MPTSAIFVLSQNVEYEQPQTGREDKQLSSFCGNENKEWEKRDGSFMSTKKSIFRNSK